MYSARIIRVLDILVNYSSNEVWGLGLVAGSRKSAFKLGPRSISPLCRFRVMLMVAAESQPG